MEHHTTPLVVVFPAYAAGFPSTTVSWQQGACVIDHWPPLGRRALHSAAAAACMAANEADETIFFFQLPNPH
jgi:hypothetical protein